jgi:hypothetical protein
LAQPTYNSGADLKNWQRYEDAAFVGMISLAYMSARMKTGTVEHCAFPALEYVVAQAAAISTTTTQALKGRPEMVTTTEWNAREKDQALADAKVSPPPKLWPSRHHAEVAVRRDKTPEPAAAHGDGGFLSLSPFVRIPLLMYVIRVFICVFHQLSNICRRSGFQMPSRLRCSQAALQSAEEAYESADGTPRKDLVAGLKRFASL